MTIDAADALVAVCGFVLSVFWYWLRAVDKRNADTRKDIDDIRRNYVRRDDHRANSALIFDLLNDIKNQLNRVSEKIDNKADK